MLLSKQPHFEAEAHLVRKTEMYSVIMCNVLQNNFPVDVVDEFLRLHQNIENDYFRDLGFEHPLN